VIAVLPRPIFVTPQGGCCPVAHGLSLADSGRGGNPRLPILVSLPWGYDTNQGAKTMNDKTQGDWGQAIVAAILASATVTSSDDPKTIISRYAHIHAALMKSGGALAPGSQPH
jgi:hypothetical protein